jgi:glycosyltransferase involved in cell wall biosynthesis
MNRKKVRVLHLLHSLGVGGAERRVLRLGLGLDPMRYDIYALTLRPTVGAVLPWPPERHTFFQIAPGLQWRRLFGLAKFMRQSKFDVVHTHNWATMFYGVLGARLAGIPVILHGEHGRNDADRIGISFKRDALAASLARLTTRVIAVNESIADDVKARWRLQSDDRVVCLPNGVDLSRFMPCRRSDRSTGDFVVGTITRFDGIKNLPCLIRAVEIVKRDHPLLKVRLVLVGAGPEFESLRDQVSRGCAAGSIEFAGETDKPQDWYPKFDLFANTSFSEGMSNSVLEAMACGLPIVASAIPGHQCWLREGVNTLFFPSEDASGLADCIVRFASNRSLGDQMGSENLQRVRNEYDNSNFLRRYDALYQELLSKVN